MKYNIFQQVTLRDFNNEMIAEQVYHYGEYSLPFLNMGITLVTPALGLREFEIVVDPRAGVEPRKHKVQDIEFNLFEPTPSISVYLEPMTLIVGQHDIGRA